MGYDGGRSVSARQAAPSQDTAGHPLTFSFLGRTGTSDLVDEGQPSLTGLQAIEKSQRGRSTVDFRQSDPGAASEGLSTRTTGGIPVSGKPAPSGPPARDSDRPLPAA